MLENFRPCHVGASVKKNSSHKIPPVEWPTSIPSEFQLQFEDSRLCHYFRVDHVRVRVRCCVAMLDNFRPCRVGARRHQLLLSAWAGVRWRRGATPGNDFRPSLVRPFVSPSASAHHFIISCRPLSIACRAQLAIDNRVIA